MRTSSGALRVMDRLPMLACLCNTVLIRTSFAKLLAANVTYSFFSCLEFDSSFQSRRPERGYVPVCERGSHLQLWSMYDVCTG